MCSFINHITFEVKGVVPLLNLTIWAFSCRKRLYSFFLSSLSFSCERNPVRVMCLKQPSHSDRAPATSLQCCVWIWLINSNSMCIPLSFFMFNSLISLLMSNSTPTHNNKATYMKPSTYNNVYFEYKTPHCTFLISQSLSVYQNCMKGKRFILLL